MNAPDKIYIPQHNIEAGNIQELRELIVEGSVEYIRKGALLEWINEKRIEFLPGNDDISGVKAHSHLTRSILLDSFEHKIKSL